MKVLVAGAGAIGQWLGARLVLADHEVTLLTRPQHAEQIAKNGLRVTGHTEFEGRVPCLTEVNSAATFDVIILTSKAHATASLAADTAAMLDVDGVMATLQNGLGNGEKVAGIVGSQRTAVALTSHGVTVQGPGRVHHAGTGTTTVGPCPGHHEGEAARTVHGMLSDAGLGPTWQANMRGPVWHKAIVNAAINPVGALYGAPNGDMLGPELWPLCQGLAEEGASLAQTAGVDVPTDVAQTVRTVLESTKDNRCSMLQDFDAGRATEIEQITGRMVRLGERLLVSMPRNESIYGRIKDRERKMIGAEASERLALEELEFRNDNV